MTKDEALEDLIREKLHHEPYLTAPEISEMEYMDPYMVQRAFDAVMAQEKDTKKRCCTLREVSDSSTERR